MVEHNNLIRVFGRLGFGLTGMATFVAVLAWSVFERGIVLGGLVGLFVGTILASIAAWTWPIVVPLLWFNRNKVRTFVLATMENMREKAGRHAVFLQH